MTAHYHHVGTGVTTSKHWCAFCHGFYGVPHDFDHSTHGRRESCACRPCQQRAGIYPSQGIFIDHGDYLIQRAAS